MPVSLFPLNRPAGKIFPFLGGEGNCPGGNYLGDMSEGEMSIGNVLYTRGIDKQKVINWYLTL